MHEHPDPTRTAARPATSVPAQRTDHGDGHSLLWMALCCAPMVLFLVALALGWLAVR
jgi:hypothetical protein